MAGQRILDPLIMVRIHASEPRNPHPEHFPERERISEQAPAAASDGVPSGELRRTVLALLGMLDPEVMDVEGARRELRRLLKR